jgi:hypothetical protein
VKCDESRPSCLRCTRFGRRCEGYEANILPTSLRGSVAPKKLISPPKSWAVPAPPLRVSFNSDQEYLYFRHFCDGASLSIAGFFDAQLWGRVILRAAERELSLRHAVIALGALSKTLDSISCIHDLQDRNLFTGNIHHQFALEQFGKSVQIMRESVAAGTQDMSTTLAGCLLVVCFESFHGNAQTAMEQARGGLKILNTCLSDIPLHQLDYGEGSPVPSIGVESDLVHAFNRLDLDTFSFINEMPVPMPSSILAHGAEVLCQLPSQFPTLDNARTFLDLILRNALHLAASQLPANYVPKELFEGPQRNFGQLYSTIIWTSKTPKIVGIDKYQLFLTRWWKSFQPLIKYTRSPGGQKELSAAIDLELRFRASAHSLSGCATSKSPFTDDMIDLKVMVALAETIDARHRAKYPLKTGTGRPSFVFNGSFILSMHIVTQKSSELYLRRRAIALLEGTPRREAMYDSALFAKLGRLTLKIEEKAAVDGVIPKEAMIQASKTTFNLQSRTGELVYIMVKDTQGTATAVDRVEFTW